MQAEAEISGEVLKGIENSTVSGTDPLYLREMNSDLTMGLLCDLRQDAVPLWALNYSGDWTYDQLVQSKIPN